MNRKIILTAARIALSLKPHHLAALKHIALAGGLREPVSIASRELGIALGISQQTASQRLLELAKEGFITYSVLARKGQVKIAAKGVEALRREYADYKRMFELAKEILLGGVVESGLGEGAFYMRQKGYKEQFRRKLGYEPYEGTLNLRCSGGALANLEILRQSEGIEIAEFVSGGRTYGGARCFRAKAGGIDCAIIMPLRSHYSDTIEVISRQNLRTRLGLKDGDPIELTIAL